MYNNPYMNNYLNNLNQQSTYENIDSQINKLQQLKEQMKNNNQQPAINQTFQLAPNGSNGMKYANSLDEVSKETIFADTPFFSKDLSVLWIKSVNGNIKAYELNEIVEKDEKDMQIELLMAQVRELKGMISNEQPYTDVIEPKTTTNTTRNDEPIGTTTKSKKSTSVQKVSRSKKEQ